jgi:hypothetical protein
VTGGLLLLRDDPTTDAGSATDSPSTGETASSSTPSTGTTTSEPATSTSPTSSGPPPSARAQGTLDPCLVGTWEVVRHEEQVPLAGTLTDLERTMTFGDDGRLTIVYENSRPKGAGAGMVFDGTVVYEVETRDGEMTFDLVENSLEVTLMGSPIPATPGSQPVDYTCEGDTFTETSAQMDAEYRRR